MASMKTFQAFPSMLLVLTMLCGAYAAEQNAFLSKVDVDRVETDLRSSLRLLLGDVPTSPTARSTMRRLHNIEQALWQRFQASPKNSMGRLDPPAVRYMVRGYFAKEHGWLIKGLEGDTMQANTLGLHGAEVLQEKAPALVENLLEVHEQGRGLTLNDMVAMVLAIENLFIDESTRVLEAAYFFHDLPTNSKISEKALHKVLQSYIVLFGQGSKADLLNKTRHKQILNSPKRIFVEEFERDTVGSFLYAHRHELNPFGPRVYNFQEVQRMMVEVAVAYGKWQNFECIAMKDHLVELDQEGRGRVSMSAFYSEQDTAPYMFSESVDYLRDIGALDETSPGSPQVLITNYVTGPSNCIASSAYFSVCCLNECEGIMKEIEGQVHAPTAAPLTLLNLIMNMSSSTVDAPRELPDGLPERLFTIASRNGGEVPIHGRLFAQWLHFAFPNECPYPSVVADVALLSTDHWKPKNSAASAEERAKHIQASSSPSVGGVEQQWSDEDFLPLMPETPRWGTLGAASRAVAQLAAVVVALRAAFTAFQAGKNGLLHVDGAKKKDDDFVPSMRV